MKSISLNNSNLSIEGKGNDKNGNYCIKVKFNSKPQSFNIQTNGNLRNTERIIKGKDLSNLSEQDLLIIEKEVVDYIKKHGSSQQKNTLKTYFKETNTGDINIFDAPGGGIDWSKNAVAQMITEQKEIKIGDSIEFKHKLSTRTFKGKYKADYEGDWIIVDCGKDGMVTVNKHDKSIKLLSEVKLNNKLKVSDAIKLIEAKTGKKVLFENNYGQGPGFIVLQSLEITWRSLCDFLKKKKFSITDKERDMLVERLEKDIKILKNIKLTDKV